MTPECRACGHTNFALVLDLGEMPLAGGFLRSEAEIATEQRFPLAIHTCERCGLVQIVDPVDPDILFKDYAFASSTVAPLVKHFEEYAGWLDDRFHPKRVVEFGCNDGILLEPLGSRDIEAIGVDISENITELGRQRGLDIVTGYFDAVVAEQILSRSGPADVVTGSNAFAHNSDPGAIVEAAAILLAPEGHLCLEMMYAGDLLEQVQWDTLYHEHLTFYSLATVQALLDRFGFTVVDAERISMHGGSIRIVARRNGSLAMSSRAQAIEASESSTGLNALDTWGNFGDQVRRKINIVADTLGRLSESASIWGYGAAGKATMWVNACGLTYLGAIVDASPLRAGRLMPGTHTPIVFPDAFRANAPDYVLVTAWNYADVIRKAESWYEGTWVAPLPEMRFF